MLVGERVSSLRIETRKKLWYFRSDTRPGEKSVVKNVGARATHF